MNISMPQTFGGTGSFKKLLVLALIVLIALASVYALTHLAMKDWNDKYRPIGMITMTYQGTDYSLCPYGDTWKLFYGTVDCKKSRDQDGIRTFSDEDIRSRMDGPWDVFHQFLFG